MRDPYAQSRVAPRAWHGQFVRMTDTTARTAPLQVHSTVFAVLFAVGSAMR